MTLIQAAEQIKNGNAKYRIEHQNTPAGEVVRLSVVFEGQNFLIANAYGRSQEWALSPSSPVSQVPQDAPSAPEAWDIADMPAPDRQPDPA